MKTMSKILATILIVVLCVSLFTVQAFADGRPDLLPPPALNRPEPGSKEKAAFRKLFLAMCLLQV